MSYVSEQLEHLKKLNSNEPEFIQAATEVLTTLEPVIEANPQYEAAGILERLTEPERQIMFRVPWVDDNGKVHVTAATAYSSTLRSVRIRAVCVCTRPLTLASSSSSASSRFSRTP